MGSHAEIKAVEEMVADTRRRIINLCTGNPCGTRYIEIWNGIAGRTDGSAEMDGISWRSWDSMMDSINILRRLVVSASLSGHPEALSDLFPRLDGRCIPTPEEFESMKSGPCIEYMPEMRTYLAYNPAGSANTTMLRKKTLAMCVMPLGESEETSFYRTVSKLADDTRDNRSLKGTVGLMRLCGIGTDRDTDGSLEELFRGTDLEGMCEGLEERSETIARMVDCLRSSRGEECKDVKDVLNAIARNYRGGEDVFVRRAAILLSCKAINRIPRRNTKVRKDLRKDVRRMLNLDSTETLEIHHRTHDDIKNMEREKNGNRVNTPAWITTDISGYPRNCDECTDQLTILTADFLSDPLGSYECLSRIRDNLRVYAKFKGVDPDPRADERLMILIDNIPFCHITEMCDVPRRSPRCAQASCRRAGCRLPLPPMSCRASRPCPPEESTRASLCLCRM